MKKYLLNEADRREIAALLSRQYSAPPPNPIKESQKVVHEEGDSYWALPTCEVGIQAAEHERIDGSVSVSTFPSYVCLWKREGANQRGGNILAPVLDINGVPVRVPVSNYHWRNQNDITQIWQKKDGTWSCEKPERLAPSSSPTTRSPLDDPGSDFSNDGCEGDCYWQADQNGVWQAPTGGCKNPTSTTTTTAPETSTSAPTTSYDPNNPGVAGVDPPATVSPCINTKCTLVCIDTSSTPPPNSFGVPTPYQRFRYALKDGSVCPTGCTCYGLGDPCFLVEGELVSNCIGTGPTTTPAPTTPSPNSSPCSQANFIFGTASPDTYRSAINRQGAEFGEWQNCKQCPEGKYPLFRDFNHLREHNWDKLASVFESPCVVSPCDVARGQQMQNLIDISNLQQDSQKYAIYRAYPYDRQLDLWKIDGVNKLSRDGTIRVNRDTNQFVANWFQCITCPEGYRPYNPPPVWIDIDSGRNIVVSDDTEQGAWLDTETNTYIYYTRCGIDSNWSCDDCKRGRIFPPTVIEPPLPPGPTSTTSTTSTTTTNPHCGCSRPKFCPRPFECTRTVCSKTRAEVFPSGAPQTTVPPPPNLPCFPSNTTTTGPTTSTSPPSTTNAPNQCIGTSGQLCICVTSTLPPSGGTCPPGYCGWVAGDPNCPTIICVECPNDDGPGGDFPDPVCGGSCYWLGVCEPNNGPCYWSFGGIGGSPTIKFGLCNLNGCICPQPNEAATCGAERWTSCFDNRPPTSTTTGGPTTTPAPCGCCHTTTTVNPCLTGSCRYSANTIGGWNLRSNTCRTACPCPPSSSITIPSTPCDTLTIVCGGSPPTQPPTTSTTSTTTLSPGVCCLRTVRGSDQCVSPVSAVACAALVANAPQTYLSSVFYPGLTCTVGFCRQTTTIAPRGACCVASRMGTAAPTWQCLNDTERTPCNQIGGLFFVNQNCSTDPCGLASTTTTTTTTSTTTTTTTTTNDPSASCCWRSGPFPICAAGYGSANCIAAGGVVISNCGACTVSTTTTTLGPGTTTTTVGPGTSTTPDPCLSCYIRQCGCSTGPEVACAEGSVLDCVSCGCVPVTTTSTPTTAPPPLP